MLSIGLTSLLAIRFSVVVKQQLDVNLATKDILKLKTIRLLARLLTGQREAPATEGLKTYPRRNFTRLRKPRKGFITTGKRPGKPCSTTYRWLFAAGIPKPWILPG